MQKLVTTPVSGEHIALLQVALATMAINALVREHVTKVRVPWSVSVIMDTMVIHVSWLIVLVNLIALVMVRVIHLLIHHLVYVTKAGWDLRAMSSVSMVM
jgi:hypothetical protein